MAVRIVAASLALATIIAITATAALAAPVPLDCPRCVSKVMIGAIAVACLIGGASFGVLGFALIVSAPRDQDVQR